MDTDQQPGQWVEAWLSPPRFGVYLAAVGGNRRRALDLYEWNAALSAAFHRDLAHLEVALRNAYDAAICANTRLGCRTGPPIRTGCSRFAGAPPATAPASTPTAHPASRSSGPYARPGPAHRRARSSPS